MILKSSASIASNPSGHSPVDERPERPLFEPRAGAITPGIVRCTAS